MEQPSVNTFWPATVACFRISDGFSFVKKEITLQWDFLLKGEELEDDVKHGWFSHSAI